MLATEPASRPGVGHLCPCPCCVAASGLVLLRQDRPAMALVVLQDLPERIRDAIADAYEQGRQDLAAELMNSRPPAKRRRARA